MGLQELIADEVGRELLQSASATDLLRGCVYTEEDPEGWLRPWRFSADQLRAMGSCQAWHPGLYRQMARTTAGVSLAFETDAAELAVELRLDAEPPGTRSVLAEVRALAHDEGPHDGISADVDGRHLSCRMPAEGEELVCFSLAQRTAAKGKNLAPLPGLGEVHQVRIWLPALRGCELRRVWCNGSFIHPLPPQRELLVLGDSIAQGFVTGDPAFAWPTRLAQQLGLDVINQGVGGQVFQPGTLFGLAEAIDPERIVVAFGANYRYEHCLARRVTRDIRAYLLEVSRLWPKTPTYVVTPLWHNEELSPSHSMSCYEQVPLFLAAHAAPHDQMELVDGLSLLPAKPSLFADGFEHPNAKGAAEVAKHLAQHMSGPAPEPKKTTRTRRTRKKEDGAPTKPRRASTAAQVETMQIDFG